MSVIVKNEQNQIKILTKGADSIILARLKSNNPLVNQTMEYVNKFATTGLRTLLLAERVISN